MGVKRSHVAWTNRQEENLRAIWVSGKSIKENLHLLGDHTYQAAIAHAQLLKLGKRPTPARSTYSAVWDDVHRLLATGAQLTARDIAERLGFSARHVTDLLNMKHKADEPVVYVGGWRRAGNAHRYVEVWALGDGDDVRKPRAKTRDDINRIRRERRAIRNAAKVSGPFGVAINQVLREAA
jgi:hypothetical protein